MEQQSGDFDPKKSTLDKHLVESLRRRAQGVIFDPELSRVPIRVQADKVRIVMASIARVEQDQEIQLALIRFVSEAQARRDLGLPSRVPDSLDDDISVDKRSEFDAKVKDHTRQLTAYVRLAESRL